MSRLKPWEGALEEDTGWRLSRHRDSLDFTDEELSTSIVSPEAPPPFPRSPRSYGERHWPGRRRLIAVSPSRTR